MTTREKLFLTKQQARDILDEDDEDFEVVKDDFEMDKNRELHSLVIKRKSDGKFFADVYQTDPDYYPWDDEPPDFEEVFPIETKTIEYK